MHQLVYKNRTYTLDFEQYVFCSVLAMSDNFGSKNGFQQQKPLIKNILNSCKFGHSSLYNHATKDLYKQLNLARLYNLDSGKVIYLAILADGLIDYYVKQSSDAQPPETLLAKIVNRVIKQIINCTSLKLQTTHPDLYNFLDSFTDELSAAHILQADKYYYRIEGSSRAQQEAEMQRLEAEQLAAEANRAAERLEIIRRAQEEEARSLRQQAIAKVEADKEVAIAVAGAQRAMRAEAERQRQELIAYENRLMENQRRVIREEAERVKALQAEQARLAAQALEQKKADDEKKLTALRLLNSQRI